MDSQSKNGITQLLNWHFGFSSSLPTVTDYSNALSTSNLGNSSLPAFCKISNTTELCAHISDMSSYLEYLGAKYYINSNTSSTYYYWQPTNQSYSIYQITHELMQQNFIYCAGAKGKYVPLVPYMGETTDTLYAFLLPVESNYPTWILHLVRNVGYRISWSYNYTGGFEGLYEGSVYNNGVWSNNNNFTQYVDDAAEISVTIGNDTICAGNSVTLSAASSSSYLWSTAQTTQSITVTPASTTSYSLTVTNSQGCTANNSITINVNSSPLADAGADDSICSGSSDTLIASGGVSYLWSTGDSTATAVITPSVSSVYYVTVTDSIGCTGVDSVTVFVNSLPLANAGTDVVTCFGDSTLLTASGGTLYYWNTGDSIASINVSPDSTTSYIVTVTNEYGCVLADTVTVTINPLPQVEAGLNDTLYCSGTSDTLTATGGDTYLWSTAEQTASIIVAPDSTTTYNVTAWNSYGCSSTASITVVTLNISPTADAGADHAICEGTTDTLTVTGVGDILWSTGDTVATITVSPDSTTSYWVTVTSGTGCFASDTVTVTVNTIPVADAGNDVSICDGQSATLTANGGTSYIWSGGFTTASIIADPDSTTTYLVTVTENGCSSTDSITVTVNPVPVADAGSNIAICIGDSATLTASGSTYFYWNTGDSTASITVNPATTTDYTVTVTNADGCSATDLVTVTVNPLPNADAGFNQSIKWSDTTTLTATGGIEYLWNTSATAASIVVFPDSSSIYYVTVTDANGCVKTDDVTVLVGISWMPYPEAYWQKNDTIISTIAGVQRVGIGTINPTERLAVAGNVEVSDTLKVGTTIKSASLAGEGYNPDSLATKSYKMLFVDELGVVTTNTVHAARCNPNQPFEFPWLLGGNWISGSGQYDIIGTCNYYPFKMNTNNIERMRITEDGDVLIGHHSTAYAKLDILGGNNNDDPALVVREGTSSPADINFMVLTDGHVYAREVEVKLGSFPDYVFNVDYNLMTLGELENYINKNKHLPGVPSANDVIKDGLNLGDMNSILLQKIEELTLYVIEQNKKIESLQKELEILKIH